MQFPVKSTSLFLSGNISWSRNSVKTGNISFYVFKNDSARTGYVRVQFTVTSTLTGEKRDFDYKINIVGTPCNYWGLRWWFLDPCDPEETRCSILYFQENGSFAGRKLLNLAYDSQSEPKNFFWKAQIASMRATLLSENIKYRTRNGKLTRKARRVMKYLQNGACGSNIEIEALYRP